MPAHTGVAPSPILVTSLLPLSCTLPVEATTRDHAGPPDPQTPLAADGLLLTGQGLTEEEDLKPHRGLLPGAARGETWSHSGEGGGVGWWWPPRARDHRPGTSWHPAELLLRSTESQRSPKALTQPPASTLQPWAHEAPPPGPPGPKGTVFPAGLWLPAQLSPAALGLSEPVWETGEGQQLSKGTKAAGVTRGDTSGRTSSAPGIQSTQEQDLRTLWLGS